MSHNTKTHLRGTIWWKGLPYPVDNTFILYGKVSRAEILATIAFTNYKRSPISYEAPDGTVTLSIEYVRTVDSRAWMTRREFVNWLRAQIVEEAIPPRTGKMVYIYAIARRQDNCYAMFDYSICVPSNIDIADVYSVLEGGPKGNEFYNFYRRGLKDRIDIGVTGECYYDSDWQYNLISALGSQTFYKPRGLSRGIICK